MRWMKILLTVLGSAWFFPISCTASLYAGTNIIAKLDSRDVSKGESVHSQFSIVMASGGNEDSFLVTRLSDFLRHGELLQSDRSSSSSFLMPNAGGQQRSDTSDFSYEVLEETTSGQMIEVVETSHDGDNTIWSRYKADHSTITPVSSRMFYFGYMFTAFPYALAFSLLLYGAGRYFKRRLSKSKAVHV